MFVHCCHCRNCQRQTGSAFVVNLLIEAERLEVFRGTPQAIEVPRDDGSRQRIFRCPDCQVAVFSDYGGHPPASPGGPAARMSFAPRQPPVPLGSGWGTLWGGVGRLST